MSGILDQIRRKQLVSSPETVNTNWTSPSVSLDDREGEFSLSLDYENGSSVDMVIYLQLSNDNIAFGDLEDSDIAITDLDGTALYDIDGSGAQFARLRIEVIGGSIDVTKVNFIGKQRH